MNFLAVFAHRETDVWSTPLSIVHELRRKGHAVTICSLFDENGQYTDRNIDEHMSGNYDVVINFDYGQFSTPKLRAEHWKYGEDIVWVIEAGDDPQQYHNNLKKLEVQSCDLLLSPDYQSHINYNVALKVKHQYKAIKWWTHFGDDSVFTLARNDFWYQIGSGCGDRGETTAVLTKMFGPGFSNKTGLDVTRYAEQLQYGKFVFQKSRHNEITRRLFEGCLTGRPVIADAIPTSTQFYNIFRDGYNMIMYSSTEELVEKIRYYDEHYDEARDIGLRGYVTVKDHHTQKNRVEQLLAYINDIKNRVR